MADDVKVQSERIKKVATSLDSTCLVIFDEDEVKRNHIRFRIESSSGVVLTSAFPQYHVSLIADMTDEQLVKLIESLTAGKLRPATR